MRQLRGIALAVALAAAPMALFAGVWTCACAARMCTMPCCRNGRCLMREHERGRNVQMAFECDCTRFPSLVTLAPLTQMMLPPPAPMPAVERGAPDSPAAHVGVLAVFLPPPFHPPRG